MLFTFEDKSYLQHYGVLGMKWGVRKDGMPQGYQGNGKAGRANRFHAKNIKKAYKEYEKASSAYEKKKQKDKKAGLPEWESYYSKENTAHTNAEYNKKEAVKQYVKKGSESSGHLQKAVDDANLADPDLKKVIESLVPDEKSRKTVYKLRSDNYDNENTSQMKWDRNEENAAYALSKAAHTKYKDLINKYSDEKISSLSKKIKITDEMKKDILEQTKQLFAESISTDIMNRLERSDGNRFEKPGSR